MQLEGRWRSCQELLLGSPAWGRGLSHEKVQHHLPSKIVKTFPALLPAGQETPPPWAHWRWRPRESTETARAQGSGYTEHPPAVQKGARTAAEATKLTQLLLTRVLLSLSETTGQLWEGAEGSGLRGAFSQPGPVPKAATSTAGRQKSKEPSECCENTGP